MRRFFKYFFVSKPILALFIVSAIIVFSLHASVFITYLKAPIITGNDTSGHAEVGRYYAEHIFPSGWGWEPQAFAGFPFPQFYPPFFFMVVAFFWKILPWISYEMIFKIIVLMLTLSIPGLLALVATRCTKKPLSWWVAGLSGALLLSTPFPWYDNLGVSLVSTISVGLVAQLISFVFLLLWLWTLLDTKRTRISYYLSIIFLALMALSNVHVVPVALIIYCVYFCVHEYALVIHPRAYWEHARKRVRELLSIYILPGILAITLIAFWLLPMIFFYWYMPDQSLGVSDGIGASNVWVIIRPWWLSLIFIAAACFIVFWKRNKNGILIFASALLALVPALFHFESLFPLIPLHTYRFLPYLYFMSALAVAFVFEYGSDYLSRRWSHVWTRIFLALICVGLFLIPWFGSRAILKPYDPSKMIGQEHFWNIAQYMKDKAGMYTVESVGNGRQLDYMIANSANANLRSDYTVLVESSMSAFFYVPLRSEFSSSPEKMAIRSTLMPDKNFMTKNADILAARARMMGVTYVLVKSNSMKKTLDKSSTFTKEKNFGLWSLYTLKGTQPPMARVLPFEPIALFTPLGNKGKTITDLSYIFLQERLLTNNYLDLTLIRPQSLYVDDVQDLSRFKTIVITDYKYHSREKALDTLVRYVEGGGKLYLTDSSDPLYNDLRHILNGNQAVRYITIRDLSLAGLSMAADALLKNLNNEKQRIGFRADVSVTQPNPTTINLSFTSQPPAEVPVLVASSYFPTWQQSNHEPLYLATPTFTLVYLKSSSTLTFTTPASVKLGTGITFLTLGILAVLIYYDVRYRNQNEKNIRHT